MAGPAGVPATALAGCDGNVGLLPTPRVSVKASATVFIQIEGRTETDPAYPPSGSSIPAPRFAISPPDAASINGWTVVSRKAGEFVVTVTGLLCEPSGPQHRQPNTCDLMVVDAV